MTASSALRPEGIRAPRGNDQAVIDPDRMELASRAHSNRARFRSERIPDWIRSLRSHVRREAAMLAARHVGSYAPNTSIATAGAEAAVVDAPWIVGGHQPELFHPGVWIKNFLIDAVAREVDGFGLHCIVDHDLARASTIKVPCLEPESGRVILRTVPLPLQSQVGPVRPWHDMRIDPARLSAFHDEVMLHLHSVGASKALVQRLVHELSDAPDRWDAGRAFSMVRHRIEREAGLNNSELPMSDLCSGLAWHDFLHHCWSHASRLYCVYNQSLAEYREREGITNPGQPVAALGEVDGWIELPFWLYLRDSATRQRMWFRREGGNWRLGMGASPEDFLGTMEWPSQLATSQQAWKSAIANGVRMRPRALMTTLFLRCFASDLFIHGIGGGIYDRLTDEIIRRFLEIEPPDFAVCSATLWLPMPRVDETHAEDLLSAERALQREEQWMRSRPETLLALSDAHQQRLSAMHADLLAAMPPRGQKKAWHHQMTRLKREIVDAIAERRLALQERRDRWEMQSLEQKWRRSREFSIFLFEPSNIVSRLADLSQPDR